MSAAIDFYSLAMSTAVELHLPRPRLPKYLLPLWVTGPLHRVRPLSLPFPHSSPDRTKSRGVHHASALVEESIDPENFRATAVAHHAFKETVRCRYVVA